MSKTIALLLLRYGTFIAVFGVFGITFLAVKWGLPLLWRTGPRTDKVSDNLWRPAPPSFGSEKGVRTLLPPTARRVLRTKES